MKKALLILVISRGFWGFLEIVVELFDIWRKLLLVWVVFVATHK